MPRVVAPNRGLILNRTALDVPLEGLIDGMNFRVKYGGLRSLNLGWTSFASWTLNGPVMLIDNFFPRGLDERLIFGTTKDLYLYDAGTQGVTFITPTYATGTASASGTAVTGTGTEWQANVKAGDFIAFGSASENDPEATWYEIGSVTSDTSLVLLTSAGTVPSGPYTIRKTFTGTRQNNWSVETFVNDGDTGNDLWIATNGVDDIISWDGITPTVTPHPEMGFKATTLANYSNMMIYGGIFAAGDEFPTSIINSDIGLPLHAGNTGTGVSEQFVVHGGTDEILNLVVLGDYLVAYAERHVVPIQFVGDPIIFTFRQALSGIGPISANAIADFGDFHEFIGADGQYNFDGVGITEINPQLFRDVLRSMDPLRRRLAFGHFDEEQGDLIWSLPLTTDADVGDIEGQAEIAFVEHYLEEVPGDADTPCSKRSFPFTATGFYERAEGLTWGNVQGTWNEANFAWNDQFYQLGFPLNLVGDKNGKVWVLNDDQFANGQPLPSYVRFGRWASDERDPGRGEYLLTRIYPFTKRQDHNLEIRVFGSDFASGTMESKGLYLFSMNRAENSHFASIFRTAKYFELQFGNSDGLPWELEGYDTDIRAGGKR